MKYSKIFSKSNQEFINNFSFNYVLTFFIISLLLKAYHFKESYIELTINKTGTIYLYYKSEQFYNFTPPDIIEINGDNYRNLNNSYNFESINNRVKLIWENTFFTNVSYVFYNCIDITEIDLSHFDFSNIIDMSHCFSNCKSLKSINLFNINTINVFDMSYMFSNCISLTSLNLSNINTSKVSRTNNMFDHCSSLKSLDLSSFDTTNVKFMDKMFSYCESLEILNIRNFNLLQVKSSNNMFSECSKLIFINFGRGFLGMDNINIFSSIRNNIILCIDKDENYTNLMNFNITYSCDEEYIHEYPSTNIIKNEVIDYCDINHLFNKKCQLNFFLGKTSDDFIYDYIRRNISNFNISLLNNVEYLEINGTHANFKITNNIESYLANNKYRKLSSCTEELKNKYNISNDNLIILITDIISDDSKEEKKSFYEFYNLNANFPDNKIKLNNFSICNKIIKNDISINCSEYSIESLIKNSCIECINSNYPIYEVNNNNSEFKKCYKDLEGYYLDNSIKKYKQCYETCKVCVQGGNNSKHNCLKCNTDYPFMYNSNCYEYCHNNTYDESEHIYKCLEEPKCFGKNLSLDNNECVDGCSNTKNKFEFNKICYSECPIGTSPSETNKNLCEIKCPKETPYENLINHQCMEKCDINHRFNNKCKLNYISSETKDKDLSEKITDNILKGEMKEVISDVLKSKKTVVIENGEEAHLISALSSNLKRTDFSSIKD